MAENVISEKTLIPMSLIVAFGSTLIGGAIWLTAQDQRSKLNAATIKDLKQEQKETRLEIREDILRLEKKIDRLLEK